LLKLNDLYNSPLRYVSDDGRIFGQFYNSYDKKYHLSEYVPYRKLPEIYLCGKKGNFSGSREDYEGQKRCKDCFDVILNLS